MNRREKQLLREQVGDVEPSLCLRSGTRIDAGYWCRRASVWLCLVGDRLVMLSVGRRRYVESAPLSECGDSQYCEATGELVIVPYESLERNRFALSPRQALRLLDAIRQTEGVRVRER